jgi:hypothetical protein
MYQVPFLLYLDMSVLSVKTDKNAGS